MRRVMIALIFLTGSANAQLPVTAGLGIVPCAEFAEFYRRNPAVAEVQSFAWAQGYWSAINEAFRSRGEPTRDLRVVPNPTKKQFLRSFCDKRPLASYIEAVRELYLTFPENPR